MLNLIHVCATIGAVMKMEKLYGNIRVNRKSLHLTQQELAERMGYERSSIAKIERGDVDLPLSKIRAFAEQFELPLSELLGLGTAEAQREIDLLYDALNAEGRSELVRYGQKLSRNGAFSLHALRYIRHYTTAAAAGYAAPIEGEDYELLPCGDDVPDGADYCIDIDGDSMEPYIRSGQRVYVARGRRRLLQAVAPRQRGNDASALGQPGERGRKPSYHGGQRAERCVLRQGFAREKASRAGLLVKTKAPPAG